MKFLLLLLGLAGFAAYILPGRLEVTPTPCLALDARAARLIEQMERAGMVSAMQSNGNREVLAPASATE